MTLTTISKLDINKKPVVVMPLQEWNKIENALEELAMFKSSTYKNAVAKARSEKKLYSVAEIKKLLRF